MPSAKKDRVTISLHLDKRIYALLKRCSEFEKEPMSRIVDRVLEPHVEKYESETLEGMEGLDSVMKQVRLEREEREEQEYYTRMESNNTSSDHLDGFARQLADFETNQKRYNMPEKLIRQFRDYVKSETTKAELEKVNDLKKTHKIESQRWFTITEKYPLPEGSETFTVKRQF